MVILFLLLILVLMIVFSYYYFYLIKRTYLIFKKNISKNKKKIFIFLGIVLSIFSLNFFSLIGLFLIHFILVSLFIDLLYFFIKFFLINDLILKIRNSNIVPVCIVLLLFIYGFFNIRNIVETKYVIYTDKNIEEDIRILLITDSHYGKIFNKSRLDDLKKRLDIVDADVVILGGDIVDEGTSKQEMEYVFGVFGNIKNKYGVYFVYGNHDKQSYVRNKKYGYEELEKTIFNNSIKILNDSYISITDDIVIIGRNDYSMGRSEINSYLDVSLDSYLIMVDHQPVDFSENLDFGIDLIVSGHTHGGQIFPIEFFINLFNTADLSYGYKKIDSLNAIVSSGVAGWGYPIRTSHHSEYVVIDIKK